MARIRNGFIEALEPSEIFVFGSNEAGRHGKGAALTARQRFGAEYGVGEGLTGRAYALPTKDAQLRVRSVDAIGESLRRLSAEAAGMPERTFYLTRVGQGLAGLDEQVMRRQVEAAQMPGNVRPWWTWESGASAAPGASTGGDAPFRLVDLPFRIVSSRGNYDVLGMRQKGQTMATAAAPGDPGWLGNPYVADDAGGSFTREQATAKFGELVESKAADPAWHQAFLDLEGKSVGYYKPEEEHIHLQALQQWIARNRGQAVEPEQPAAAVNPTGQQVPVAEPQGPDWQRMAGDALPWIAAAGGSALLIKAAYDALAPQSIPPGAPYPAA